MSQTKAQLISDLVQALNFTGTASAPANGAFLSSANKLAFASASTERLTLGSTEVVVNETGTDTDFRVEGNNNINLLLCDAGNDRVGIGLNNPATTLSVDGVTKSNVNANSGTSTAIRTENGGTGTTIASYGFASGNSQKASIRAHVLGDGAMMFHNNNDTEKMRIDASGNVGIGTTSPDSALHVYKQTNDRTARFQRISSQHIDITQTSGVNSFTSTGKNFEIGTTDSQSFIFDTNGSERMRIHPSSNQLQIGGTTLINSNPYLTLGQVTNSQGDVFHLINNGTADLKQAFISANKTSRQIGIDVSADTFFIGRDSSTTDLTINSSGNVGIGTTSPAKLLDVKVESNGTVEQYLRNTVINLLSKINGTTSAQFGTETSHPLAFLVANNERMRIDSSGNVVVGATSANGSDACTLNSDGEFRGAGFYFSNNIGSPISSDGIRRATTATMVFDTGSAERMRINSSGNVGIGGTAPNYQLHVVSSIGVGSHGFAQQLSISNQRIQSLLLGTGYRTLMINGLGGDIVMGSGSTQRLAFGTNDGVKYSGFGPAHGAAQDVGLNFYTTTNAGTTFVNHFRIDHNGDLLGTDTNGVSSISDSRVKTDITDYTYDVEKFKQFAPKQFNWKNPEYHGEKTNVKGFLAQDLEAIDTQWVGSSFIEKDHPDYDLVDKSKNSQDEDVGVAKTSKFGGKDAMYISVINQMITKIETLETKVAALEAA